MSRSWYLPDAYKKIGEPRGFAYFFTFTGILLTDTKLFVSNDSTVTVDVGADKIIQQTTTFTYQHFKSALSGIIFVI